MKPHPRIRKTIKWGGAAVTVLLVVVWIGSGWRGLQWCSSDMHTRISIEYGTFMVARSDIAASAWQKRGGDSPVPGFTSKWNPEFGIALVPYTHGTAHTRWVYLPIWMFAAVTLGAAFTVWRLDTLARRRALGGLNLCPKCNYDRAGIGADAVCPECGSKGVQA